MTQTQRRFDSQLWADCDTAILFGQDMANENGSPVAILMRDGWFAVCEEPPDEMDEDPLSHGWIEWALIDPHEAR